MQRLAQISRQATGSDKCGVACVPASREGRRRLTSRGAQTSGRLLVCLLTDASTYNCGFHSFEQCRETVLGAGGWCRPNFFEDRPGGQRNRAR